MDHEANCNFPGEKDSLSVTVLVPSYVINNFRTALWKYQYVHIGLCHFCPWHLFHCHTLSFLSLTFISLPYVVIFVLGIYFIVIHCIFVVFLHCFTFMSFPFTNSRIMKSSFSFSPYFSPVFAYAHNFSKP